MSNVNTGITLVDVRSEAMAAIKKLQNGEIDIKTAAEIRNLCGTIIDVAKTQVEFLKALPNSLKEQMTMTNAQAMAGTLVDRDAELDETLHQIEQDRKKPYR